MTRLWTEDGDLPAVRLRVLDAAEIAELLRSGPVAFVVADVGLALRWVPVHPCYSFWKSEARARIVGHRRAWRLEEYPGEYCCVASLWSVRNGERPLVLLEKSH